MGVSGSGKSTVGAALAGRMRVPFEDADDLHPQANIDKMSRGEPLDDSDRFPWLEKIGEWLVAHADGGVIACSALKRRYRDQLRHHCSEVVFLHLEGGRDLIERRQASRPGHFMPSSLLTSQFSTLEPLAPDERGVVVDVGSSVDQIVEEYVRQARLEEDS
ncbi:gluconokinase [Nocardioides flavescens]|uniref:Gluconokinase n=1 Tax=Nocardioides flavescens TaxID=2691959 RepID=A0A6L7F3W6_9ACTN|nr:gluconokinase [Nocardioides flavescens]MXG91933.1 gluconokinase [Nocardioides flavescens]